MSGFLPFISKMRFTPVGLKMLAARPYSVSVGRIITPSVAIIFAACINCLSDIESHCFMLI